MIPEQQVHKWITKTALKVIKTALISQKRDDANTNIKDPFLSTGLLYVVWSSKGACRAQPQAPSMLYEISQDDISRQKPCVNYEWSSYQLP